MEQGPRVARKPAQTAFGALGPTSTSRPRLGRPSASAEQGFESGRSGEEPNATVSRPDWLASAGGSGTALNFPGRRHPAIVLAAICTSLPVLLHRSNEVRRQGRRLEAIKATLPLGTVVYGAERTAIGVIWRWPQ